MAEQNKKVSYKDTLNLPHTEFPIRPNAKENDPRMLQRWSSEDIYSKTFFAHAGAKKYILHDGPPYANGNIHLGTAANKMLKDMAAKGKRMQGLQVPITPGWDCHGLPIELKVTQEMSGISGNELIKACRAYAKKWMCTQREQFKALGVMMNWDHPYLTMNPGYESKILQAFGQLVGRGYIERQNKTVPWCASCQTVLAAAEIEYYDRKDPSIYVLFPLKQKNDSVIFSEIKVPINLLIWTTTPWTLPLNRAVLVHPQAKYQLIEHDGTYFIVGKELSDKVCSLFDIQKNVVAEVSGKDLSESVIAHHPFIKDLDVPLILDDSVALDEGTALVHCAPGCGPLDYEIGTKNKLDIFSPISSDGKYTSGIEPAELEGMPVADGQIWVLKKLNEERKLFHKKSIRHSYPHCWRCRNGLIFRATKQWFCSLTKHDLKKRSAAAVDTLWMIPKKSENRLKAAIESRWEWCLSRQRIWGVPIPALICKKCDHAYINQELVDIVASHVEKEGIEYWQSVSIEDLLPGKITCAECGGAEFKKEYDILDVWFDSGVSHFAVLKNNPELGYPADLYIEAKDQHRGWFQSSLLTSMAIEKSPCTKTIITHGYTVDGHGRKMSKSLGNVMAPQEVMDKIGTDGLRLWMASIDYTDDLGISNTLIKNVAEVYRKIRNTCRFLLSNLYDFEKSKDEVSVDKMLFIDQYALYELCEINKTVIEHYNNYDFTAIYHLLAHYCSADLSSFYLDIVKDRLYTEKSDGLLRRSAQTTCWYILDTLTKLTAPILSFTAEHLSDFYQKDKTESIHLQQFNRLDEIWNDLTVNKLKLSQTYLGSGKQVAEEIQHRRYQHERWDALKNMRSALLRLIEDQREKGNIKHSLEAKVVMLLDSQSSSYKIIEQAFKGAQLSEQTMEQFLKEFLIVSQVQVAQNKENLLPTDFEGLFARIEKAEGTKCPRCWQWEKNKNDNDLCVRCKNVVEK